MNTSIRFFHFPCIAILAVGSFLAAEQSLAAEHLQCGFGTTDITPPVGYRMSGYFYERFSTGVASPLEAKCIVLQQGDVRMAWVFCDLVGVPAHVTSVVRDQASSKTGIPRENIFIAGTHTHTGPLYFGPLRNYFHSQAVEKTRRDEHEAIDFPDTLRDKLVALIVDAAAAAQPSELAVGMAERHGLSFNRRYVMRDGSVRTNPGKGNPDIVRPAGPVDPQVGIIQFRRGDKPVAGLTVFALHLDTTGGTDFAPDFPLFLSESLRETYGDDYVSIFGLGTCGNINHFDLMNNRGDKGAQEAKRIGEALASKVKAAAPNLAVEEPRLAAASVTVQMPLQSYTEAERSEARAKLSKVGPSQLPMLEQVKAVTIVGIDEIGTEKLPMDVQAFRLSDSTALVTLPGELFVELGLLIKQNSPFETTFVVELANDYPGYIPTRQAFAEGSYEPTNSKVTPGGGEMLRDAAIELLKKLHAK